MTKLSTFCQQAFLVVTLSCRPIEPISLPVLSADQAAIEQNGSAHFAHDVVVQVTNILDWRCPQDVVCTLAGTASAKLTIRKGIDVQGVHLQLNFSTLTRRVDSTGVTLAGEAYKVILRAVVPYPNTSKRLPPKQAIVQLTKL